MRTARDGAPEMPNLEPRNDCVYGLSTLIPLPLEHGNHHLPTLSSPTTTRANACVWRDPDS